jgi:hypothetical protein
LATLSPAALKYSPAVMSFHSLSETVGSGSLDLFGLISSFGHFDSFNSLFFIGHYTLNKLNLQARAATLFFSLTNCG